MNWYQQTARILFASGMIGLGLLGLAYGDFALVWQPVPLGFAGREVLAYLAALLMVVGGIGLLFRRTAAIAARVLFSIFPRLGGTLEAAMLTVFTVLVWIPAIVGNPSVTLNWTAFVISGAISAGARVVAASLARSTLATTYDWTAVYRCVVRTVVGVDLSQRLRRAHRPMRGDSHASVP